MGREGEVRITADTNVLVRAVMKDHPGQSAVAIQTLLSATSVAVPLSALCELVWVLRRTYQMPGDDIAERPRQVARTRRS